MLLCLAILLYTYLLYGGLLYLLSRLRPKRQLPPLQTWPELTLLIPAYNEVHCLAAKIRNSLALDYPVGKLQIWVVTDGSDDGSAAVVAGFAQVRLFHQPQRQGKLAALQRLRPLIGTDLCVLTDANSLLNPEALRQMVRHFADPAVGAVAGEKRIVPAGGTAEGEGLYWRYESQLKSWDARLCSVVGAAGELLAIRTELWQALPPDTLIEDFVLSMRVAANGKTVAYEPAACAMEAASPTIRDEWQRKIRIAAGGAQTILRYPGWLNPLRHGWMSWQYASHRVLRWTLGPLALLALLPLSMAAVGEGLWPNVLLGGQMLAYMLAVWGGLQKQKSRSAPGKVAFLAFYFLMMNAAVFVGWWRYLSGKQSVIWTKINR